MQDTMMHAPEGWHVVTEEAQKHGHEWLREYFAQTLDSVVPSHKRWPDQTHELTKDALELDFMASRSVYRSRIESPLLVVPETRYDGKWRSGVPEFMLSDATLWMEAPRFPKEPIVLEPRTLWDGGMEQPWLKVYHGPSSWLVRRSRAHRVRVQRDHLFYAPVEVVEAVLGRPIS